MFLIQPRHKLSSQDWGEGALSQSLLYDLSKWRDDNTGLVGRVSSQVGYMATGVVALVELVVRIPLALFSKCLFSQAGIKGYQMAFVSLGLSLYATFLNLFVENVSSYLTFFNARLYSSKEVALYEAGAYGDAELAQFLLKQGADPHKRMGIYTAAMAPTLFNHLDVQKLYQLNRYEQEYFEVKKVAAWHNLMGTVTIDGEEVRLEGSKPTFHAPFLSQSLNRFFAVHKSETHLSEEHQKMLTDALHFSGDERATAKRIEQGDLTFVHTGWEDHGISVTFFGDYMAIGNRGSGSDVHGTLLVYKIDRSKVDAQLIEEMQSFEAAPEEEGIDYFYRVLPRSLLGSQDAVCQSFEAIAPKLAKSGNCALASTRADLLFPYVMLLYPEFDGKSFAMGKKEVKLFSDWAAVLVGKLEPASLNDQGHLLKKVTSIIKKYIRYHGAVENEDPQAREISGQAYQLHRALRDFP